MVKVADGGPSRDSLVTVRARSRWVGRPAAGQFQASMSRITIQGPPGGWCHPDFTLGAVRCSLVLQLGGTCSPAAVRKVLTPHGSLIQSFGDGSRWFGHRGNIIKAVVLNALVGQTL